MVGSVGGTSNLISMISSSYYQNKTAFQGSTGVGAPPPPPPPESSGGNLEDPLGVFATVDSDSDSTISESEYKTLTKGILEITGNEFSSSFLDFDADGDGELNRSELKSVLDKAGFAPPPPQQVISAYETQSGEGSTYKTGDETMMAQLLDYLESRSGDLDITA